MPTAPNVSLTSPFAVNEPALFSYTFTGVEPVGTYTTFVGFVVAGGLRDGALGPGELLAFIQSEVTRTGAFPSLPAMQAAMGLRCARSVEASLQRLLEGGFITREVIARKHTRRVFAYRLVVAEAENQQAPELNLQEFA